MILRCATRVVRDQRARSRPRRFCTPAARVAALLPGLLAHDASAGNVADYIDSIDFNDYALSMTFYGSKSRYRDVDDTGVLYPMLSSFEHSSTTDQPLFVRDAYMGLRSISHRPWTFGAVATIQTDGFGPTSSEAVAGMQSRGWTVAAGVLTARRFGPVHADLFATTDVLGEHGGQVYDLKLASPFVWPRLQLVPQVEFAQYSADYVDHY